MQSLRFRFIPICSLAAVALVAGGCGGAATPAPPIPTTNVSQDPAEQPLPRPEEGLAYVQAALKDKTRLIEVFTDHGLVGGALDGSGRSKLRKAVPNWWKGVEVVSRYPKPHEAPFRVTPDLGIRVYPPGSVAAVEQEDQGLAIGRPNLQIMIYKARQISRVLITDPTAGRVNQAVYIIPTTEPMDWVNQLFAGKL
jgi:hypothetical protein